MRSSSSTALAHGRSVGSVRHNSPPSTSSYARTLSLLDLAAENLMVRKDFRTALDISERGLETLCNLEETEDSRYGELKAALCVVGIQALAELNQWVGVLDWVLQHYGCPEKIPAKIMQMCILLYAKVGEHALMKEAASVWLNCPSNGNLTGFGTVAELHLLHVLVPLGCVTEARELVVGEVGNVAFTEDHKHAALEILEQQSSLNEDVSPSPRPSAAVATGVNAPEGAATQRLEVVLRLLYRGLSLARARIWAFPIRKVVLTVFLLYLLLVRLDPALPSSFLWIAQLQRLLRQMWNSVFAPYYCASSQI